jgi:5-methylcytosine-specific restriction endonuclease McrA
MPAKYRRLDRDQRAPGLTAHARAKLLHRWRRQGRPCAYCENPATTVDHLIPLYSHNDIRNLSHL